MTVREIMLRYQNYNPATGKFDAARTRQDYARLLGVHPMTVSRLATGQYSFSLDVARGLARVFPETREQLAAAILSRDLVA